MAADNISIHMDHENGSTDLPFNEEGVEFPDYEASCPESESLSQEELEILTKELELTNDLASLNVVRKSNFDVLNTILSEYLDSYVLIGYTAENDEVVARRIMNSRDSRAILSLLEDVSSGEFLRGESDELD